MGIHVGKKRNREFKNRGTTARRRALECQICLESITMFSTYFQYLQCKHTTCRNCWQHYTLKSTCPSCRVNRDFQEIGKELEESTKREKETLFDLNFVQDNYSNEEDDEKIIVKKLTLNGIQKELKRRFKEYRVSYNYFYQKNCIQIIRQTTGLWLRQNKVVNDNYPDLNTAVDDLVSITNEYSDSLVFMQCIVEYHYQGGSGEIIEYDLSTSFEISLHRE